MPFLPSPLPSPAESVEGGVRFLSPPYANDRNVRGEGGGFSAEKESKAERRRPPLRPRMEIRLRKLSQTSLFEKWKRCASFSASLSFFGRGPSSPLFSVSPGLTSLFLHISLPPPYSPPLSTVVPRPSVRARTESDSPSFAPSDIPKNRDLGALSSSNRTKRWQRKVKRDPPPH